MAWHGMAWHGMAWHGWGHVSEEGTLQPRVEETAGSEQEEGRPHPEHLSGSGRLRLSTSLRRLWGGRWDTPTASPFLLHLAGGQICSPDPSDPIPRLTSLSSCPSYRQPTMWTLLRVPPGLCVRICEVHAPQWRE